MKQHEVITLGHNLMKQHGLIDLGWSFQMDNSVRRFGVCKYRPKVISLSKKLCELNTLVEVTDVILHEIAHAIAGHKAGHGYAWKLVCIRIGAKPERCYDSSEVETPDLRYVAKCGGCGKEYQKAKRPKLGRRTSCMCQAGIPWDKRHILQYKDRFAA